MINLIFTDVNHLYIAFVIISAIALFVLRKMHHKKPAKGKLYHGMNLALIAHGIGLFYFAYKGKAYIDFWSNEEYFVVGRIIYTAVFALYLYNVLAALFTALGNVKAKCGCTRYVNLTWILIVCPTVLWLMSAKLTTSIMLFSVLTLIFFAAPLVQMIIIFFTLKWRGGLEYNALLFIGGGGIASWVSFHFRYLLEPRGGRIYFWVACIGVFLALMLSRKNLIMDRIVKYIHRHRSHTDGCM